MKLIASIACALTLAACSGINGGDDDDNPEGSREFQLRIENIAPWKLLKATSQSTIAGTMIQGPAGPTQSYEIRFTAGPGHKLMFATTLLESNDWFLAPESADGIPLYVNGQQFVGDITSYVRIWDAGSELNQELGVGDATCAKQTVRDYGAPDPDPRVRLVTETAIGGSIVPAVSSMVRVTLAAGTTPDSFVLRIVNVSNDTTLQTSIGTMPIRISPVVWTISRHSNQFFQPNVGAPSNGLATFAETATPDALTSALRFDRGVATALGRGVFLIHREPGPLFHIENADFGIGMEPLAEDGEVAGLLANLSSPDRDANAVGSFETPVDAPGASPALPGQAYEFTFRANLGDKLAIAMSFTASNDWFFGSPPEGIPLFLGDFPRWEDVTPDVRLYDLGTEGDEELDVGLNVGTQQAAPNSGRADGKAFVREVTPDRYATPINQHVRLTLTPIDKITN